MVEQLESAAPEGALSGIEQYADEAAELIETTGLAAEAEIPTERRPVLKRNMLSWEEFGFGHTEKHPTRVSYCFTETNGTWHYRLFDYLPTCGITMGPELDSPRGLKRAKVPPGHWAAKLVSTKWPPPLEPDSQFIQTLVVCLKGCPPASDRSEQSRASAGCPKAE